MANKDPNLEDRVKAHLSKQKKAKAKGKKIGRNLVKCARYKAENRREKNKARRAARRLKNLS